MEMYKYTNLKKVKGWEHYNNIKKDSLPQYEAYVDGSYSRRLQKGGIGVYILKDNEVVHQEYKTLNSQELKIKAKSPLSSELNAAIRALEIAKSLGIKELNLIYDCHAIISSVWDCKVKNEEMYIFRLVVQECLKSMRIVFTHASFYKHNVHNNAHRLSRKYLTA